MRRLRVATALLIAGCCGHAFAGPLQTEDARLAQSRALTETLGSELRQSLLSAMARHGPAAAIDVCRVDAPDIARRLGRDGVRVGRTALRVRNPGNAADTVQRQILQDFERRFAAGEPPDSIEHFEQTYQGGARYMKAIVTQPLCTACHGKALDAAVADIIKSRYPDDEATGFESGSLRGAFVVEWPADSDPH